MSSRWLTITVILTGAAVAATGLLIGWMVGVSASPVVGAALPVVVGVLGAAAYGVVDKNVRLQTAKDEVEKALAAAPPPLPAGLDTQIRNALGVDLVTKWLIPVSAAHVFLFGVCTFCGMWLGSWQRRADVSIGECEFPKLVERHGLATRNLTTNPNSPGPVAQLYVVFHSCKRAGWRTQEIDQLFGSIKKSILDNSGVADPVPRLEKMAEIIVSTKDEASRYRVLGNQ